MVDLNNLKFGKIERIGKTDFQTRDMSKISKFESISPPSVFIGSKLQYPLVNVGILSPVGDEENASQYEDCEGWAKNDVSIRDVLKLRGGLLNSRFRSQVTDVRLNKRFVEIAKDIAISARPVDVEIELKDRISMGMGKDQVNTPHGMRASLKDAKVTSNVKVDKFVDRAMNDEIRANEGMKMLYSKGINEYGLQKILSVGVMGLKADKKMVPTRWSITATDDILSKDTMEKVRNYPELSDHQLFFGEFLGNQYIIMLFPGRLSFELFELYYPGSSWNPGTDFKASHDYEGFHGRTKYAENCVGGYYATRLPIVEYLNKIKRQAGIFVVRLETPSYWAALGVWVVRESVKRAINKGGLKFGDKDEFLEGVKKVAKIKYDFDIQEMYDRSWYLNVYSKQKQITDWF
ncbi:MAG: hypothetical protein PF542_02855 [Nanoarchaeota archaeon]|jgi:hypothetical protein|nr:hypothetical protein [Nanoarchaeota archaeon]